MSTEHKAVTLMGMSGAGKTHFAARLAAWGWAHYSCDYLIGSHYLSEMMDGPVTVEDLSPLSRFIGQVGSLGLGGLPLDEFKRRQALYYEAECSALRDMRAGIDITAGDFVNDSTGSFCEIEDEELIAAVAERSLLVYIETPEEAHGEIIMRAQNYPKPLYFPPDLLEVWLAEYLQEKGLGSADEIKPDDFSAWVFPKLFESRLPKYERLAAMYGVKVAAADLHGCEDEAAFLDLIGV